MCGVPPQTEAFTSLLRLETVSVAATAAIPETGALALCRVKVPLQSVVLTTSLVLFEETCILVKNCTFLCPQEGCVIIRVWLWPGG